MHWKITNKQQNKEYIDPQIAQEFGIILLALMDEFQEYAIAKRENTKKHTPMQYTIEIDTVFPLPTREAFEEVVEKHGINKNLSLKEQLRQLKVRFSNQPLKIRENLARLLGEEIEDRVENIRRESRRIEELTRDQSRAYRTSGFRIPEWVIEDGPTTASTPD